jgi:hypothetical protein
MGLAVTLGPAREEDAGGYCVVTGTLARGSIECSPVWQRLPQGRYRSPAPLSLTGSCHSRGRQGGEKGDQRPGESTAQSQQRRLAGPSPTSPSSVWPTPVSAPAPPGSAAGVSLLDSRAWSSCPTPHSGFAGMDPEGGHRVARHRAGGTGGLAGVCVSRSLRTHLGVGFVRVRSHLRGSPSSGGEADCPPPLCLSWRGSGCSGGQERH